MRPLAEAGKAALSFIFYNPTYFIILSFYALCRIDDISWGTKGLNNQNSKQSKMQDKWKLIKLIHVGKYTFWNITASVLLISSSTMYYPQFYISFAIMIIIVFTIGLKIVVGAFYLLVYKLKSLCTCCEESYTGEPKRSELSSFVDKYKSALETDITSRVGNFQGEMRPKNGRRGNSFIISLKKFSINPKINEDAVKKFKK
jgi:chitin synthase